MPKHRTKFYTNQNYSRPLRKGSRLVEVCGEEWSWYRGKKFVEIRSPDNKAELVPLTKLETYLSASCDPEEADVPVILPGRIHSYILARTAEDASWLRT